MLPFTPETTTRVGDHRQYDAEYAKHTRAFRLREEWGVSYELYQNDLRELDIGLVQDKLERAVRAVHVDYLQLDTKPRRAVLLLPSLFPTPLLEITLKVLFDHFTQTPSVSLLTQPVMCCVSAGVRNGLVIDIGWEETTVTAIGEYKQVSQKRSVRAGKQLTREMGNIIEGSVPSEDEVKLTFEEAEDFSQRMAWCRSRHPDQNQEPTLVQLPVPGSNPPMTFPLLFDKLAEPAERVLFASGNQFMDYDDHELPIQILSHRVLLSLPADFRALCISRVMVTGLYGKLPGLKQRMLQELTHLISTRGWDAVDNYGSAKGPTTPALKERSPNATLRPPISGRTSPTVPLSPLKMPLQDSVPHKDRVHDDIKDPITQKAEREQAKGRVEMAKGVIRGVETLGAWAGASLTTSMRVKGAYEIDREEFVRSGLRDQGDAL
jgi:actin-related protein